MKKLLPKSFNNPSGFTLIELMVVISIIAILAVIGISVYSGAQGSARDGRRRSEIESVSKSIEASKNYTNNVYRYSTLDGNRDFPRGIPSDPTVARSYCIQTSASSTTPPAVLTAAWVAGCPGGWSTLTGSLGNTLANNLGAAVPDVTSWTLCASLERTPTPFCASSLTQ